MAPFSVTVPPGVLPGQALHVQIGGHVVAVQVPPGTAPGAVLSIEVDLPGTQPQRPPRELAPPPERLWAKPSVTHSGVAGVILGRLPHSAISGPGPSRAVLNPTGWQLGGLNPLSLAQTRKPSANLWTWTFLGSPRRAWT